MNKSGLGYQQDNRMSAGSNYQGMSMTGLNQQQYGGGPYGEIGYGNQGGMQKGYQGAPNQEMYGAGMDYDNETIFANNLDLKEIFEAFQNKNGKISIQEFLEYLNSSGVKKNCSILIDKLNAILRSKNGVKELDAKTFASLFEVDLSDRDNFRAVFNLIDQSKSDSIGIQELNAVNQVYELNLKKEDMQVMIENLKKSNLESVTLDELYNALYKFNQFKTQNEPK